MEFKKNGEYIYIKEMASEDEGLLHIEDPFRVDIVIEKPNTTVRIPVVDAAYTIWWGDAYVENETGRTMQVKIVEQEERLYFKTWGRRTRSKWHLQYAEATASAYQYQHLSLSLSYTFSRYKRTIKVLFSAGLINKID